MTQTDNRNDRNETRVSFFTTMGMMFSYPGWPSQYDIDKAKREGRWWDKGPVYAPTPIPFRWGPHGSLILLGLLLGPYALLVAIFKLVTGG